MLSPMPSEITAKIFVNENIFRLLPLESSLSLPIPMKINGKVFLTLISFTGKKLEKNQKITVFPPNAKIILDFPRGKIVHYIDLFALKSNMQKSFNDPIGDFPHEQIKDITLSEYKRRKKELLIKYDRAIELFDTGKNDQSFHEDFRKSFFELCEPCIIPYLKKMCPAFFKWLEG